MQPKFNRPQYMAKYMRERRARVGVIRRLLESLGEDVGRDPGPAWPYPWPAIYLEVVKAAQDGGLTRGEAVLALTMAKVGKLSGDMARDVVNAAWEVPEDPAIEDDTSADDEARHIAELNRGYSRDRI